MSPNHINNQKFLYGFKTARQQSSTHHLANNNNNRHHYLPSTLTSIALIVGSASLILSGCQSSMPAASSKSTSGPLMDFSTADMGQSQQQGLAFNASMDRQAEHYAQLFDQDKYPNSDHQAKTHLLAAIRQHFATEHVAVSKANYHAMPFVAEDSIDAGSSSLLKTIIETYAYQSTSMEDREGEQPYSDDYDYRNGYENDDYEKDDYENDVYEDMANPLASEYDNEYSKAERDAMAAMLAQVDEGKTLAESGYGNQYEDEHGYDADEYGQDEYNGGGAFSDMSDMSGMSSMKPKTWLKNYEAMQMAKQSAEFDEDGILPMTFTGMIGQILGMFNRTPEQIAASNAYQYQNLTFNSVSQYKPKQRQLQSIYSYDYITPTISSSIQIPLSLDFDNSSITVDPSAIMPIVALANPEHTPLPNQMTAHTVRFGLPERVTAQLPPAVVYDTVLNAIQNSMAELDSEYFSAVDISDDAFAKEVGAARGVKVYFGSKQSGEMIGKVLKYVSQSLQGYVDANPEKYPNGAGLKAALDKIQLYNQGYQSADVGSLLQLIEAIGPISFNQVNYYYLDSSDRLLGKQQRLNIGGDLMGSTTTMINQVRYDQASFNRHALTPLLQASFGANAVTPMDGNAWLAEQRQQKDRLQEARYVRYDYDDADSERYENADSESYDNGESSNIETTEIRHIKNVEKVTDHTLDAQ